MDAFRLVLSSREVQNDHVHSCINYLRQHPRYRQSTYVYIPECAPGSRGGELAHELRNVSHSLTMCEFGRDKRPGVPKTNTHTEEMVRRMRRLLVSDSISFAADMGVYGGREADPSRVQLMKDSLCDQLLAFRREQATEDAPQGRWTGKGGKSHRDDMGVALLMGPLWIEQFLTSDDYASVRRETSQRFLYVQATSDSSR